MKKFNALFLSIATLIAFTSCTKQEAEKPSSEENLVHITFLATSQATKTSIDSDGSTILFSSCEHILIYDETANRDFTTSTSGKAVDFSGDVSDDATKFYGLYPYNASASFKASGSSYKASTTLSSKQNAKAGTFDDGVNIAAGFSTDRETMSLYNVLSLAKVSLSSESLGDHEIASITLESANYALAGDVVVNYETVPTATAGTNTVKKVILSSSSSLEDGDYYLAVLPNAGGEVTLTLTDTDGNYASVTKTLSKAFSAGVVKNLGTPKDLSWTSPSYELVTEAQDDWTGNYVIVYAKDPTKGTGNLLSVKSSEQDIATYGADIAITDSKIAESDGKEYNIEIAKTTNGYSMKLTKTGEYLGYPESSSKNILYYNTTFTAKQYEWTFSVTGSSTYVRNVGNTDKYIRWNNSSPRFACYTSASTVKWIYLYKLNSESSSDPVAPTVPVVQTGSATEISSNGATLSATYSDIGTKAQNAGFLYGTSSDAETLKASGSSAYTADVVSGNGSYTVDLSSLSDNTTYYYMATVQAWDESTSSYTTVYGDVKSFKTEAGEAVTGTGWLVNYEIPAVATALKSGQAYSSKIKESYCDSYAYVCDMPSSMQKVVTHTYVDNKMSNKVRRSITMLYDGDLKVARWVAFAFNNDVDYDVVSRTDAYSLDPAISSDWQASTGGYGTGYTRGHQAGSNFMKHTTAQNKEVFYMTNITPQSSTANSSSNTLEMKLKTFCTNTTGKDTTYVVTGTYFDSAYKTTTSGNKTIAVPTKYYYVVMKCSFNSSNTITSANGAGWIFDHSTGSRTDTTIDEVEALTGYDFFTNVPKTVQDAAESKKGISL